jgi:hypothetical protein
LKPVPAIHCPRCHALLLGVPTVWIATPSLPLRQHATCPNPACGVELVREAAKGKELVALAWRVDEDAAPAPH